MTNNTINIFGDVTKTILNLNNGATISAEGKKQNKHCKPVLCIERGKVYTSIYDAAMDNGITFQYLGRILAHNDGYYKKKNLHFKFLVDRDDGLDAMTTHVQKLSENYDELVAKAKAWDELVAKQEAERIAEEKRQEAIAKLEERIAKHKEKERKEAEIIRLLEEELNALNG